MYTVDDVITASMPALNLFCLGYWANCIIMLLHRV